MSYGGQEGAWIIFLATIGTSLVGLFMAPGVIEKSLFRPYWLLRKKQYDTIYMSGFVHADLGHLLFNMVTFYFFAFPMERVLGTGCFIALYVAGLLLSHLGTYAKQRHNPEYASLGASGAISAVLFAYIVYFPTRSLYIIPIPVPIPAFVLALGYVAYSYYAARRGTGRINHDAHLYGALGGLLFVLAVDPGAYRALIALAGF